MIFSVRIIATLFLIISLVKTVHGQTSEWKNFGNNPGNLKAYIHSPFGLNDSLKYPLVIVLHGCTQNALEVEKQSGWSVLADTHQFYVLYPEQKMINNPNLCFNWFLNGDNEKDKGEAASVHQMMIRLTDSLSIDTTRIFVYGLSAGGAMSVVMMACYPQWFHSGAVLAGGPYQSIQNAVQAFHSLISPKEMTVEKRAEVVKLQNAGYQGKYPKMIVLHGRKDKVVSFKNAQELIKQWTGLYPEGLTNISTETEYEDIPGLQRKEYADGMTGETEIIFYDLEDGTHTLPVDPGNDPRQGGKTGRFATDADFFSTWYIARDFGLLKE